MKKLFIISQLLLFSSICSATDIHQLLTGIKNTIDKSDCNAISDPLDWDSPQNAKLYPDTIITSTFMIEESYVLQAYNRNNLDGTWKDLIIRITNKDILKDISKDTAISFYNSLISVFGNPLLSVDYGLFKDNSTRYDMAAQWAYGNFSLLLNIIDIEHLVSFTPSISGCFLEIKNRNDSDSIKPLIGIKITPHSVQSILGSHKSTWSHDEINKLGTFTYILDYNHNTLLGIDLLEKGIIESVSDDKVIFSISFLNSKPAMVFNLNRFSGDISISVYDENTGRERTQIIGRTEKIDIDKPLF